MKQQKIDELLKNPYKTKEVENTMSKFNFPTSTNKAKFENFVPMELKRTGNFVAVSPWPTITLTNNQARFNVKAIDLIGEDKMKFIQLMIQDNFIAFKFSETESENSLKLAGKRTSSSVYFSFKGVATELAKTTDFVNLEAFTYKFKLQHDEDSIYYIDLSEPVEKSRSRKKANKNMD